MTQSDENFRVPTLATPQRLDHFLIERFPETSRKFWRERIGSAVSVDGKSPKKGQMLRGGEAIEIHTRPTPAQLKPNPAIPVRTLYQDNDLLALDKPAFLPSHSLIAESIESLANAAAAAYPELLQFREKPLEAGLIHRLDNDTSGVLLFARNESSYQWMKELNRAGEIEKFYLALVEGIAPKRGVNPRHIAHHPKNSRKMVVTREPKESEKLGARPALTEFRRIKAFSSHSLLLLKIRKGQRHQIRVHLADLGFPIVGDRLYDAPASDRSDRHLLHAYKIELMHPILKQRVKIRADLPDDFLGALKSLAT